MTLKGQIQERCGKMCNAFICGTYNCYQAECHVQEPLALKIRSAPHHGVPSIAYSVQLTGLLKYGCSMTAKWGSSSSIGHVVFPQVALLSLTLAEVLPYVSGTLCIDNKPRFHFHLPCNIAGKLFNPPRPHLCIVAVSRHSVYAVNKLCVQCQ